MTKKVLDYFSELEDLKKQILHQKNDAEIQNEREKSGRRIASKSVRMKKEALETQMFCYDGPFLVIILIELNKFYSIAKNQSVGIQVDLDGIPKDIVVSLTETIFKKRHNPSIKMKYTITEGLLGYLKSNNLSELMRPFDLKTDKELNVSLRDIIVAHNLKK